MAYNDLNITSAKTDVAEGPIWWNSTPGTEPVGLDFDFEAAEGWVKIGDASSDGYEWSRSADSNEKRVFNRTVGMLYSNFVDTLAITFAASTDPDVNGVVFGKENVAVDPSTGNITISHHQMAAPAGHLFINTRTDDGRRRCVEILKAQPSVEITQTWTDEDIVGIETEFTCSPVGVHPPKFEYIEGFASSTPPED